MHHLLTETAATDLHPIATTRVLCRLADMEEALRNNDLEDQATLTDKWEVMAAIHMAMDNPHNRVMGLVVTVG